MGFLIPPSPSPSLPLPQLRAPGSPVIIVGTHLDMVSELRSEELQAMAREKYGDTAIYPRVTTRGREGRRGGGRELCLYICPCNADAVLN